MKYSDNRIIIAIKGLAVLTVSLLVVLSCGRKSARKDGDRELLPVQSVDSMFVVQTENGMLKSRMEATLMQRFETDSLSYDMFRNGFAVYSYNEGGALESIITAETARHYKFTDGTEKWEAFGNVVIRNIIKNETMETDTIYWNRSEEKIYTHCYVKMYSGDGFMQGYGMQSDEHARNSILLRPFDGYGYVVQDTTKVRLDSINFIGPMPKK